VDHQWCLERLGRVFQRERLILHRAATGHDEDKQCVQPGGHGSQTVPTPVTPPNHIRITGYYTYWNGTATMICPHCAHYNDPALTPSGRIPPKDWDPIICVGCHRIMCIDHTAPGGLRFPDDSDRAAWKADHRLNKALEMFTPTRH